MNNFLDNIQRTYRALCRQTANHCIFPGLRHFLFKRSGLVIGEKSFVNMGIWVVDNYQKAMVVIGKRVSIAPNVTIVSVSSPNDSILKNVHGLSRSGPVVIEDDVWIGAGVVILPNVRIGRCSVIGSNSVVTEDVAECSVMAGIPAKKIRSVEIDPNSDLS